MDKETQAKQWLAEFSALLNVDDGASVDDIQLALKQADRLVLTGPELLSSMPYLTVDAGVVDTLSQAVAQMPSVAEDLRRRLDRATGRPLAADLDLDELRERLSERAARTEVGLPTEEEIPVRLELPATEPNFLAGAFTLLFGLGWTSFTTVHAILMIGGMYRAFGFVAFGLLLFYSLFFVVGFAMLYAGYRFFVREDVQIEGLNLTLTRSFAGVKKVRQITLSSNSVAEVAETTGFQKSDGSGKGPAAVRLTDAQGKKITIMAGSDLAVLKQQASRINAYLKAQRALY